MHSCKWNLNVIESQTMSGKKVRPFLVSVRELNFLRKRQWDNRLHSIKNTMDVAYGRARSGDLRIGLKRE